MNYFKTIADQVLLSSIGPSISYTSLYQFGLIMVSLNTLDQCSGWPYDQFSRPVLINQYLPVTAELCNYEKFDTDVK